MQDPKDLREKIRTELIRTQLMTPKEFEACKQECENTHKPVIEVLFGSSRVNEKELVMAVSRALDCAAVNLEGISLEDEILKSLPKELAQRYQILPIKREERTLTVAIGDPTNLRALDDAGAWTGLRIRPAMASPNALKEAIGKYYGGKTETLAGFPAESFEAIIEEVKSQVLNKPVGKGLGDLSDLLEVANATPVVRLVNHLLIEAIRRRASDVFIEPMEKNMRIRYRVDGLLEEILKSPRPLLGPVVSRIKVMSRLNIAEHRIPQDGRFKARIFGPAVDFRVSILPTCFGEKACLRLLDPGTETQALGQLGFGERELDVVRHCAGKPHGMILVTGPTGSGKTTTLYAVLQYLNSAEKNITTVEDPVEYQLQGVNQVNVREQVGLTFPVALRSILRQDPDIILIGEIRDLVTMDIAIKSALTGHLVLSTLHTNDATSAIVRMVNMGIEPFLIASSVLMISAQRLVRKLCPFCRIAYTPERELLESMGLATQGKYTFYHPKGCDRCRSSGFKGRTVIAELFEMTPPILDVIVHGKSNEELRRVARENGMTTLRENGISKVREGITSIEEVLRVAAEEKVRETQEV